MHATIRNLGLASIATIAISSQAFAQGATQFASFQQITPSDRPFTITENGNASTLSSDPTELYSFNLNGSLFTVNLAIASSGSQAADLDADTPNPGQTQITQDFTNVTYTFTQVGTGANVLTVVSGTNPLRTIDGSDAGTISSSTSGGNTVSFTSAFLSFAGSTERSIAFSFTAATPNFTVGGNSFLNSTNFSGGGNFSTNVAPTAVVPEPSALAFALVSSAGLVGLVLRARRRF